MLPFFLVRVTGPSMQPTLREGDVLLVRRVSPSRLEGGHVVIVDLPPDPAGRPRPRSVKRLTGPDPDDPARWWIDSDNPREGVTSFDPSVGSLPHDAVHGRALLRIRCTGRKIGLSRL